jgi:hypothetical protein
VTPPRQTHTTRTKASRGRDLALSKNADIRAAAQIVLAHVARTGYWFVPTPSVPVREALRAEIRRQARRSQTRVRTRTYVATDAPEGAEPLVVLIARLDRDALDDPAHLQHLYALGLGSWITEAMAQLRPDASGI